MIHTCVRVGFLAFDLQHHFNDVLVDEPELKRVDHTHRVRGGGAARTLGT